MFGYGVMSLHRKTKSSIFDVSLTSVVLCLEVLMRRDT
ncbi:hypothetical protein BRARA_F02148 [Brassica rapa]|uniref:Uncharacterized protein n=1 Tax=Brassica campestris TaxID=3711 RepID=A0A397Z6T7_BRACM|nr:hypothetical protein BRARA_F02148 [Brassica rapa]